jgi:hypothetical protein
MSTIQTYTKGAKDALKGVETYLTESINRHGGVQKPEQAVSVLNDVVYYLHKELVSIPDGDINNEQEWMNTMMSNLFSGIEVQIVKGGRN